MLSDLDEFAKAAMAAIVECGGDYSAVAVRAYNLAEAMLREREKRRTAMSVEDIVAEFNERQVDARD